MSTQAPGRRRLARAFTAVALAALATTTAVRSTASAGDADGLHLEGDFARGGSVLLELELGNVAPIICFGVVHDAPAPGDSITTRIRLGSPSSPGPVLMTLSSADQWLGDTATGCAMPRKARAAADLFHDPTGHYFEFTVVKPGRTARPAATFAASLNAD